MTGSPKSRATLTENIFVSLPSTEEIRKRIAGQARAFRGMVTDLCAACGRTVPDWWTSGWGNAFALADYLGGKLTESGEWSQMAAEWRLDSDQTIGVNGENKLRIRGRIDLILAQIKPNGSDFAGADIWIVDYKTGNTKALTVSGATQESRYERCRRNWSMGMPFSSAFTDWPPESSAPPMSG